MRRALYWLGVLLGVGLLVGGALLAVHGYRRTGGPADAVRGYFDALGRSDAPRALAYGDVPDGPHTLLTADVLRAQQHIAPLRDVVIEDSRQTGSTASVTVRYVLAYRGDPQTIDSTVHLHKRGGRWRLDAVAVRTALTVDKAGDRATILGAAVPDGDTLLFPGAVPVGFDTPYLQLDPTQDSLTFGSGSGTTAVLVELSPAGRAAALRALSAALRHCLAGGDVRCPLPNDRYVPGTVRGTLTTPLRPSDVTVTLGDGAAGSLVLTGKVRVDASFTRLSFANQRTTGHGRITLPFLARAYAVQPIRPYWTTS